MAGWTGIGKDTIHWDGNLKANSVETGNIITSMITALSIADTQLVFSDNNVLTGDSNLTWDNTNKRLGIGIITPL